MFNSSSAQPNKNDFHMEQQAFSVSEVNAMVSDAIAANLPGFLWVEGEVSNLSVAASGHRYLSLQDNNASISCALFRGSAGRINAEVLNNLRNGDKVVVKGSLSVYKPRGSYQLIISDVEPAGFGELAKNFIILKEKLDKEGLTSEARKKPLPSWPRHIAVVTSATGAAIRDVVSTLKRRAPFIPLTVYPTMVQGERAPEQIIQALDKVHQARQTSENPEGHDIVLLVRGGGSIEDLIAFNDESLAYAVARCELPIVTGIGHETDFTIVDFVSDYRAPTPTGAAEISSPDKVALSHALHQRQAQLFAKIQTRLGQNRSQLAYCAERLNIQHPMSFIEQQTQRLDELDSRIRQVVIGKFQREKALVRQFYLRLKSQSPQRQLQQSRELLSAKSKKLELEMQQQLSQSRQELKLAKKQLSNFTTTFARYQQQLKGLQARLVLLSPLGVLDRGYALVFDEQGKLLKNAQQTQREDTIRIRLASGEVEATVNKIINNS